MKKFLIFILIVLIGVGVYFFFNKNNKGELKCEDGFRFVPSSQTCESVEQPAQAVIDFSKVILKVPETNSAIQLQKNGDTTKYTGVHQDAKDPSVREAVSLESKALVQFSSEFILIPFTLDSGGSGQFTYIGLFDVKSNTHLDSVFIGDRISVDSIQVLENIVKVNFKTRLDSESFAAQPTIPAQIVLKIENNSMTEIMKLQNADYGEVELRSPVANSTVTDNLVIKGAVPGSWYFEANAQFKILDNRYNEIAIGNIQALSDWMTTQRVPFEVTFSTTTLNYIGSATIVIQSENTQGGEEGEYKVKKMFVPVVFK